MSASAAETTLSWLALAVLALAFAGLVVRFAELRRDLEIALQLRGGDSSGQSSSTDGLQMLTAAHQTLRDKMNLGVGEFVIVAVDPDCSACAQVLRDIHGLLPQLPATEAVALLPNDLLRVATAGIAPDIRVVADAQAWAAIPGERPVVVVGDMASSRFASVSGREHLIRLLAPQLHYAPSERPS